MERWVAGALRLSLQLLLKPRFSPRYSITSQRRWLAAVAKLRWCHVPRAARSVCEITAERWHVFQMHGGPLRSADGALDRVAGFLDGVLEQRRAA